MTTAQVSEWQTERTKVRSVYDMPDDIFMKHLAMRHPNDFKNLENIKHFAEGWTQPWRSYHDRLHEIEVPGQYDHYHSRRRDQQT